MAALCRPSVALKNGITGLRERRFDADFSLPGVYGSVLSFHDRAAANGSWHSCHAAASASLLAIARVCLRLMVAPTTTNIYSAFSGNRCFLVSS
jgi:hypothetical protein